MLPPTEPTWVALKNIDVVRNETCSADEDGRKRQRQFADAVAHAGNDALGGEHHVGDEHRAAGKKSGGGERDELRAVVAAGIVATAAATPATAGAGGLRCGVQDNQSGAGSERE